MNLNTNPLKPVPGQRIKICPSKLAFKFNVNKKVKEMKRVNKQKGFTIIELVVVILLLGILTATALPRFMDVTDDAHDAVVSAVVGGFGTGTALFRAQWYADNQPGTITEFNNLRASMNGYPIGLKVGGTTTVRGSVGTSAHCMEVFQNLLQGAGQPTIAARAQAATAVTAITTVTAGTDFVAYLQTGSTVLRNTCNYIYSGQYTNLSVNAVPVMTYNASTGAVTVTDL